DPALTLEELRRFTLETIHRIFTLHPGEFGADEDEKLPDGGEGIVFSQRPRGRRMGLRFEPAEDAVQLWQLTNARGDAIHAEQPVRAIETASPSARADI